jgi:RND family efflux transporter MFP subunit
LDESKAKTESAAVSSRLSGEVSSQRRSNLAFRVPGFVQEIKLRPGNSCKKGDVLAVLDPRDFRLNFDIAKNQRDLARVALDNSKGDFDREEQLRKENASTAAFFDKVKAGYEKAKLDYELADLNVRRAEQALSDTRLVAPYDCVVAKQMKYVGENVQSGNAVFEIYDTTDVELNFSVPERLAGQLKVGDSLQVSIPATAYKGSVEIIRLVPVVEESSRTFRVVAKAPQDQRVVPGLYAEASLR